MHIAKLNKPVLKGYMLYDSNYMTFWKRQNYEDSRDQQLTELREKGGMNKESTEDFQGSETILYDTIMVDICHCTFVNIHRMYNTE